MTKTKAVLIRGVEETLWRRVKAKAAAEGMTMNALLIKLLTQWVGKAALIACIAVAASAAPVHAQSLKLPAVVFGAAAGYDAATTVWFMNHSPGHEINPLVSWIKEPAPMIAFGAALETTAATLITRKLAKNHPKMARYGLFIAAGLHASFASWNTHQMLHRPKPH